MVGDPHHIKCVIRQQSGPRMYLLQHIHSGVEGVDAAVPRSCGGGTSLNGRAAKCGRSPQAVPTITATIQGM